MGKSNLLRFPRAHGEDRPNNSAKPVDLVADLVENSTEPGELCVDWFWGTGATTIACEQIGRLCYAMDKEPKWVATGLQRLTDMGLKPIKVGA